MSPFPNQTVAKLLLKEVCHMTEVSTAAITHPVVSFMLQPFHTAVGRLRVTCITTAKRDKITVVPLTKYASVKNQVSYL